LRAVQAETRKESLENLDLAEDALISVAIGFEKAMDALIALQSENLPDRDIGQPVLNLVTEHEQ
jgi:hypothetical protein